jgi:hypothetical protein
VLRIAEQARSRGRPTWRSAPDRDAPAGAARIRAGWRWRMVWNAEQTDATLRARRSTSCRSRCDRPTLHRRGREADSATGSRRKPVRGLPCHRQQLACDPSDRSAAPAHLNRDDPWHRRHEPAARMAALGRLEGLPATGIPRNARPTMRARRWTHAPVPTSTSTCGHCHSRSGPADTSGSVLDASTHESDHAWGECKPPVAAGQGTGRSHLRHRAGRPDGLDPESTA